MCKKFTPFQITVMVIFIFLSTYGFAQTRYDVDNPPPNPARLPNVGTAPNTILNINHRNAVKLQDQKKSVCYLLLKDENGNISEKTGVLVNTVNNSFVNDEGEPVMYLLTDSEDFNPTSENDKSYISFDYEVAHSRHSNQTDIGDDNEYNTIRQLWAVELENLTDSEEGGSNINLMLYRIKKKDGNNDINI